MPLSAGAQRVQDMLTAAGLTGGVVELAEPARTAAEAARAVGCRVEQIVKSLVFRGTRTGAPIMVLASGTNRVNERAIAALVGEPIEKADADFVREHTGFAIGGVPPFGHAGSAASLVDADLLKCDEIWAAAGHPNAVFRLTPADLVRLSGGRVAAVT